jgi:AraC-like DNA-binding protein
MTAHPRFLPGTPELMSADTLSDVLQAVRLTGAVFYVLDTAPPWAAEADDARTLVPRVMPGAQHLISYHVVTRGACFGRLVDTEGRNVGEPVRLGAGDVIVFPHGDRHVMSSAPDLRPPKGPDPYPSPPHPQLPFLLRLGGEGEERCGVVCGFLGCDARPFNPLLANLPRVLHVSGRADAGDGRLRQFVELAIAESQSKRVGGESILARLSELMFVEVLRRHLESLPSDGTGWLAGLRDPTVGRALARLHERPALAWTVEGLAKGLGTSRSALAERFTHYVGQAPMQYLARWRMQVASGLLAQGGRKVSAVAFEVGYDSEAAFSRAFKKLVGVAPGSWARQRAGTKPVTRAPKERRPRPAPAR